MVARVHTVAFQGIETKNVSVQVHLANGMPGFSIVGLADKAVAESRERIKAAFHSMGLSLPSKKITVNLAPADLLKEGSHFDLPVAIGLLAELGTIPAEESSKYIVLGELALDGKISSVYGVLPSAMAAVEHELGIICPHSNGWEAAWSGNTNIIAADNLLDLVNHLNGETSLPKPQIKTDDQRYYYEDLKDIKGQQIAKRALEIAAAGGHNMMMIGPPGSGKSMLAKRLPGLLPELLPEEMLEVSVIASIAGLLKDTSGLIRQRPYRDPHSSSSMAAMVGGGRNAKPGEVTMAHLGVLFLDELPEFSRVVLESLRQPIEQGTVTIARVNNHVTYPSKFQLIAAMNPCKCGYFGEAKACSKVPVCAENYQGRISGPLLDRFDIRVDVPSIKLDGLQDTSGESTATVRERVIRAREIQAARYQGTNIKLNAHADGDNLVSFEKLCSESQEILKKSMEKFNLSMRAFNRILRVARTIADLESSDTVKKHHIIEALSFRNVKLKA